MDFNKIKELDSKNYIGVFNRQNLCFTHGKGNRLYDTTGKEYVDFVAGIAVNCLGYSHPALTAAIAAQAEKLIHISNLYYNEPQAELSEKLLDGTVFDRVFLCNSGAEANEGAIKLVRKFYFNRGERKPTIITALGSFHGRTLATTAATGQEKFHVPYSPIPEGFKYVPYGDLDALKNAITDDVGAVMLEPVQGESGVNPASYDYLVGAYALCRSKGILLVLDEVQTGVGRTGKFFAFEHYGIQPDVVTLAKGLGGGVPIGAVLAGGEAADAFKPGDHGSTFGGNPLACAAANAVLDIVKKPEFLNEVTDKGEYLKSALSKMKKYNFAADLRGLGLMQGLQLSPALPAREIVGKMATQGFLLNAAGNNTLRFVPPLTIEKSEIDEMAAALGDIFSKTNI